MFNVITFSYLSVPKTNASDSREPENKSSMLASLILMCNVLRLVESSERLSSRVVSQLWAKYPPGFRLYFSSAESIVPPSVSK